MVPAHHCFSQSPPFYHINSSNGLSGDNVTCAVTDKSGLIWIGTTEGLNLFDGYQVNGFKNSLYPDLSFTKIICLFCDSHNRIWVSTIKGLILLDSNRNPHKIEISASKNPEVIGIIETEKKGLIVLSGEGSYSISPNADLFDKRSWVQMVKLQKEVSLAYADKIKDINHLVNDEYIICYYDTLTIIDYAAKVNLFKMVFDHLSSACRIDDENILVASQYGNLYELNIKTKAIIKEYHPKDGKNVSSFIPNISKIREVSPGVIAVASYFGGLYLLDIKKETYIQYLHDALNEFSISENRVSDIFVQKDENIFVATFNSGLNLFNISQYGATNIPTFANGSGNVFDGYVNAMITDKKKQVWIAAFDKVILWNPSNNSSRFMPYYKYAKNLGMRPLEVKALCIDSSGRVWVSLYDEGIAIIDEATGKYKLIIKHDTSGKSSALKSAYIHSLEADGNGKIWASSGLGIFTIDTKTFAIDTLLHHPLLKELAGKRIYKIWFDHDERIWFASELSGAYCYDRAAGTLKNYFTREGLPDGIYYSFAEDKMNNIYMGTSNGLGMLKPNGAVKVYNETNGLKGNLCTGLLADEKGDIWIGCRHNTMVQFSPADSSFKYYAEASGFRNSVFKINSFYKEPGGDMYWGTNRGLSIFDPEKLDASIPQFNLSVQKLITNDSMFQFTTDATVNLQYKENDIAFYFTAINFSWSKNILYEYKLDEYDNNWIKATDVSLVKYNSLDPGKYTFRLKASKDGVAWINSLNEITIIITPPFWKTWWFRAVLILALFFLTRAIYLFRIKTIRLIQEEKIKVAKLNADQYKSRLEMEQVINYFTTSLVDKHNVDEVLWDVAKNLIGRLGFVDCMIYLWNDDKTKMVQKAGYGPKGSLEDINKQPFDVAEGQGVVGYVMKHKEPVIIPDTSVDERYRPDEMVRASEITIPIVYNDNLIGIIDSEHPEKNFFTEKHLQILITIAALMESKMHDIEAQQSLQMAQKEKAEMQYESLKQQLNPHFLFNSLAAVIGLIKNEPKLAVEFIKNLNRVYRYILQNKDEQVVTLQAELDFAQQYFQLQKIRFGNGIDINIDIDEVQKWKKIVPVILQNLIENAIKHNIVDEENPLYIEIFTEGDFLSVKNNMQKRSFVETSNKQGLENIIALYSYLSDKPVYISASEDYFTVKIPLL